MDLGTAQKKLLRGEYETVAAFRSDIILVFENCVLYNKAGSRIVQQVRDQRKPRQILLELRPRSQQARIVLMLRTW